MSEDPRSSTAPMLWPDKFKLSVTTTLLNLPSSANGTSAGASTLTSTPTSNVAHDADDKRSAEVLGVGPELLTDLVHSRPADFFRHSESALILLQSLMKQPWAQDRTALVHLLQTARQLRDAVGNYADSGQSLDCGRCVLLEDGIHAAMRLLVAILGKLPAGKWERTTGAEDAVLAAAVEEMNGLPQMVVKWTRACVSKRRGSDGLEGVPSPAKRPHSSIGQEN